MFKKTLLKVLFLTVAVFTAATNLFMTSELQVKADTSPYVSLQIDEKDLAYGTMFLDRDDPVVNDDMVLTHASQNQRTIIGFTPDSKANIATINRLNLEITYRVYDSADIFKWWPKERTTSATVYADKNYKIMSSGLKDEFRHVLPRIGRVEEVLVPLHETVKETGSMILTNPFKAWYQNKATDLEKAGLLDQEFYVIMPVSEDIKRVWISIDGYTVDGDYITDGTNGGSYFQDGIGKYIDIPYGMPRLVYFPKEASIFKIVASNASKTVPESYVQIAVGSFDNDSQKILNPYQSFVIGNNGTYHYRADVQKFDEVMFYYVGANMDIRIYYVSDGVPMYSNIVDNDGNLQPEDQTPTPCDLLCQLKNQLDEVGSFFKKAWAAIKIVGAVLIAATIIFAVIWGIDRSVSIYKNLKK